MELKVKSKKALVNLKAMTILVGGVKLDDEPK